MAENINLLPQQNEEKTQQSYQRKLINQVSAIVLAVCILAVAGLFAGKFVLGQQLKGIEDEIQTQQDRIQAKKDEEGIQRSLVSRIHALDKFFSTQNHYSHLFKALESTYPETLKLVDMNISEQKVVTLTGTAATYADLTGFYAKIAMSGAQAGSTKGTDFINPTLTSINRNNETGLINFALDVGINPNLLKMDTTNNGESQ